MFSWKMYDGHKEASSLFETLQMIRTNFPIKIALLLVRVT